MQESVFQNDEATKYNNRNENNNGCKRSVLNLVLPLQPLFFPCFFEFVVMGNKSEPQRMREKKKKENSKFVTE